MRALIASTLFALVVLAATCEGAVIDPFALHHAKAHAEMRQNFARTAMKMKEAMALGRGMKPLQQTADPICATPEATSVIAQGFAVCATASEVLQANITSVAQANTYVSDFCTGECGSFILNADTRYLGCLPGDASSLFAVFKYMCEKRNDKYCGASLLGLSVAVPQCDRIPTDSCARTTNCEVVQGTCQLRVTSAVLTDLCSPCLDLFTTSFPTGGLLGASAVSGVRMLQNTVCLKQKGEFCYPQVQDILTSISDLQQTQMDGLCTAPSKLVCLGKIVQAQLQTVKAVVEALFITCARSVNGNQALVDSQCKPIVQSAYQGFESASRLVSNMCTKNGEGLYCFGKLTGGESTAQSALVDQCFGMAVGMATCNATCDATLGAVVNTIGCCLGNVQAVLFANSAIPDTAYPSYNKTGTAPAAPPVVTSPAEGLNLPLTAVAPGAGEETLTNVPRGGLEGMGACASLKDTIRGKLTIGCAAAVKKTVRKALKLKLRWSSIQSDTTLRAKLVSALTRDFATAAGVGSENVKNAELVEDTSVQVAASSRRQTTTSSGTKFQADIEATTNAVTEEASAAFDAAATAGALAMTETSAVIATDCTTCAESNSALVAGTESSSSSSSALIRAAVAILAVLAMVL